MSGPSAILNLKVTVGGTVFINSINVVVVFIVIVTKK